MERPAHLTIRRSRFSPGRIGALSCALLLQAGALYTLAAGLSFSGVRLFPHTVLVEFFKTERPEPKPVALQVRLVKPPVPVVPPPEIQIQTPKPPPHVKVAKMRPHPVIVAAAPVQKAAPPAPPPAPPKPRGITAPVSIGAAHNCEKQYPPLAVRLSQEGTTTVRFLVNTDGSVSNVQVARSSGHEMLDQAAIGCAGAWRYRPALQEGRPVAAPWTTAVQWKLKNRLSM